MGSISTWIDLARRGGNVGGWGVAGVLVGGEFSPVKGAPLRLPCPCVANTRAPAVSTGVGGIHSWAALCHRAGLVAGLGFRFGFSFIFFIDLIASL
jgi:hypothetical protein